MDTPSKLSTFLGSARDTLRGFWLPVLSVATTFLGSARDKLRGITLLLIGVATLWLIAQPNPLVEYAQPVKIGLLAWLVCKISIAAYLGYWIDRLLHPRSRPGALRDIERMAAEKRRAFIVCACILAAGFFT